jgi:hypothetical protein
MAQTQVGRRTSRVGREIGASDRLREQDLHGFPCGTRSAERQSTELRFGMLVNAQLTTVPEIDERQFSDTKRLLLLPMRRLKRALGLRPVPPPELPDLPHPLESLTFCNGTVCQMHGTQLGGEYMALSGIEVVRKHSFSELDDERCEYRFELNLATDSIWRWMFQQPAPRLPVRFEGRVMVLTCLPADLEGSYRRIKQAIARANVWYARERERLIPQVIAQDEERQAARELEQNRRVGLQRQFECLLL